MYRFNLFKYNSAKDTKTYGNKEILAKNRIVDSVAL